MRVVLFSALLVALATPALAQDTDLRRHEVGPLTVSLPGEFASVIEGGVSVVEIDGVEIRQALFAAPASDREVGILVYTGQSWLQRFRFKRGYGASDETPHTYSRVDPSTLPLTDSFGRTVGSAFTLTMSNGESAVLVRGCDGDVCYEVTSAGPEAGADTGLKHAALLAGVAR